MMSQDRNRRRFTRSSDSRVLGGVCGGIADYFGFNLAATRLLAVIALLLTPPFTLLAYFGTVILVPSAPTGVADPRFQHNLRSSPKQTMNDVRARFRALDRRLARLEKFVTSSRYQLDREFRDLERH
jgi:phage shock protein C